VFNTSRCLGKCLGKSIFQCSQSTRLVNPTNRPISRSSRKNRVTDSRTLESKNHGALLDPVTHKRITI
jgi:hypothetical protein